MARTARERVATFSAREEARLMNAARAGDPRALGRLLTALSGPAYRFGRGFCRDPHDAEDVMQEVLAALARGLLRFRGDASLTSWAYVVARRACMRHRRRRSGEPARIASLDSMPDADGAGNRSIGWVVDHTPDPLARLERRQLADLIERAMATLPASQREVLVLRDVEGLSARAVSRALGIGERAVKSRLHRARVSLKRMLEPQLAPEPASAPRPAGCPDTPRLISRYLEGELTAARCRTLAAHVRGCPLCGPACETLRAALGACRAWGRAPLPVAVRDRVREAIRALMDGEGGIARERART